MKLSTVTLLLLVAISLLFSGSLRAAMYTLPGTGLFDQSLGTLDSVEILISPPATATTDAGSHSHTLNPTAFIPTNTSTGVPYANGTTIDFLPITLSITGLHTHTFDISAFATSMGTIDFPSATSSSDDSHNHTINFASATVASGQLDLPLTSTSTTGLHSHVLTVSSFTQTFSGSELDPFLTGSPIPTINPPNTISATSGFHAHQLLSGSYQALINGSVTEFVTIPSSFLTSTSSGHTHSVDIASFDVTSTTFYYTPVPEPSSFILVVGVAIVGVLFRRRHVNRNIRTSQST